MKRLEKWKRIMAITLTALMVVQQGSVTTFAEDAAIQEAAVQTETAEQEPVEAEPTEAAEPEAPAEESEETPEAAPTEAPEETTPEPEQEQPEADDSSAEKETEKPEEAKAETEETKTPEKTTFEGATDNGTASVTLSTPISEKAVFVAKQYGQETDYFNNAIEKVSQWAGENNLAIDDAVVYDMHFEENGSELAVCQNATVNLNFASPILAGKGGDIYVLHVVDGTVSDVNGGISQNGDGSVSAATINTNGFSPFVFVRTGGVETASLLSTNLNDFVTDITFDNVKTDADGKLILSPGSEYGFSIGFAEVPGEKQMDVTRELVYTYPDELTPAGENGTFEITAINEGVSYTVKGNSYRIEGNKIILKLNQDDPNFKHVKDASNVAFNVNLKATVNENASGNKIKFGNEVEKEVTFKTDAKVSVKKKGSYDKATGKFKYEVEVKSTGTSKNVQVRDNITGSLLKYANDLQVTPQKGNLTSSNEKGFLYTIPSMKDGEVIKFTYSADIDYSKLGDSKKFTADETSNTVTAKGDNTNENTDTKDFEHTTISTPVSKTGKGGKVENGKQTSTWTITVNEDANEYAGGRTITDILKADEKAPTHYSGKGLTVKVYDKDKNLVDTLTPGWDDLQSKSDTGWTYKIPENTSKTPYKYVISYTTESDVSKVLDNSVHVRNTATDSNGETAGGDVNVGPGGTFAVSKQHKNAKKDSVDWTVTVKIPDCGFNNSFTVTDVLPDTWANNHHYIDGYVDDSMNVKLGDHVLSQPNDYSLEVIGGQNEKKTVKLTFKNVATLFPEVTTGTNRVLTLTYKTKPDPDWPGLSSLHINTVTVTGDGTSKSASDSYTLIEHTIIKTTQGTDTAEDGMPLFKFDVRLKGVNEEPTTFTDDFDTDLFELYDGSNKWCKPKLGRGQWEWQASNGANTSSAKGNGGDVTYQTTENGVAFTISNLNKKSDGNYWENYCVRYTLKVKNAEALQKLKQMAASDPEHKASVWNTATWDGSSQTVNHTYTNTPLTKTVTENPSADNNYEASFKVVVNPDKLELNGGHPIDVTDVVGVTSGTGGKIKLLPDSLKVTLEPEGTYTMDYSEDRSTLTLQVPDKCTATITYKAKLYGKGEVKYNNKVKISGEYTAETGEKTVNISSGAQGTSEIFAYTIVKKDAKTKEALEGAQFQLYDITNGEKLLTTKDGKPVIFITDGNGIAHIRPTDETASGWHLYAGHRYKLVETVAPEGYEKASDITFTVVSSNSKDNADVPEDGIFNGEEIYVYDAKAAEVNLTATKELTGKDLTAGEFSFKLTPDQNNKSDNNGEQTVQNDADGNITFDTLKFSKPGTYRYTITEVNDGTPGVTYDGTVYHVTIEVTANAEGALEVTSQTITSGDDQNEVSEIAFSNIYVQQETETEIKVSKKVNGANYRADEDFKFTIIGENDAPMPENNTVTVKNGKEASFGKITYTKEGTYRYVIQETKGNLPGMSYDKAEHYVTVKVEQDKTSGELNATVTYDGDKNKLEVVNEYDGTTKVEGTKSWNVPEGTKLPEKITVDLLRNGTQIDSKEVTAKDEWKYSFANLPKYSEDGKTAYTYTVEEEPVKGYTSKVEGYDIINTITGTTSVEGTKTWNAPEGTKLPEKIIVYLIRNGETIDSKEVTAKDGWSYSWEKLPKYSEDGTSKYTYTVDEEPVAGYNKTVDGFNITNTKSDVVTVEGTKTWNAPEGTTLPESITVNLLRNGDKIDSKEVTAADNWSYSWTDLPAYSKDGKTAYTYTVDEEAVPGYEKAVSGYNITNTITGTTEVKGTKSWNVPEGTTLPEKITVDLLRNNEVIARKDVTEKDQWKYSFDNLPKYSEDGKTAYTYTVKEEPVKGYTSKVEGYDIINTITGTTKVEGTKSWNVPEGTDLPESITVILKQNGTQIDSKEVTAKDEWKYSFDNLPKYSEDGKTAYTYIVKEEPVKGYTSKVEGYDIINTITGTTSVEGTKTWNAPEGTQLPEKITVYLIRNGETIDSKEVTAENSWTYSWTGLPKYSKDGMSEYTYTVDEEPVAGYNKTVDGFNITNTKSDVVTVEGTKTWNAPEGTTLPESITVNLLRNGDKIDSKEVTAKDNWTYKWTELDAYSSDGKTAYTYAVSEDPVEGYTTAVAGTNITNTITGTTKVEGTKSWNVPEGTKLPEKITVDLLRNNEVIARKDVTEKDQWKYSFDNLPKYSEDGKTVYTYTVKEEPVKGYTSKVEGYDIINTITGTTKVEGTKSWNVPEGTKLPEKITVDLLRNGTQIDSKEVTAKDGWSYSWEKLPKYSEDGKTAYTYTVEEKPVEGYTSKVEGYDIINTITGTTSVEGTKTWNAPEGTQLPEKITVYLIRNGETIDSKEVTAENGWSYSWEKLPKYSEDGMSEYTYTVDEEPVVGYNKTVDGFNITNTKSDVVTVEGTKTWNAPEGTNLPEKIIVDLLRNGTQIDSKEVTAKDNWTYKWTELDAYSPDGKTAYTYTVSEDPVEGYTTAVAGTNITNTITGTTKVEGTKSWNVPEGTTLPEKITVDLLRNGTQIDSKEVTAENGWSYAWEKLPKYSEDGKTAFTYTIKEEPVKGYTSKIEGYDIINTITGTTSVEGTKTWNVPEGTDLPKSITVDLLRNGTQIDRKEVTAENDWSYSWTDLPKYSEDGHTAYTYTVDEANVPDGYNKTVSEYNITNTITGTTSVEGTKTWEVLEGIDQPESIVVNLLRNGEKINSKKVTAEDNWSYSWTDLPKYSEDGLTAYEYTVDEEEVKGYDKIIDGYNITNKLITKEISVNKTDITGLQEVPGAKFVISFNDGKNVVKEWTSGETPETITDIVPGITYTLEETAAPEGYEKITNAVNFVVDEEGNVTVTGSAEITVNGEKVPEVGAEGSEISVKDTMIRSPKATVEVTKTLTHNELALGAVDQTFYVALYGDEACTVRLSDVKAIEFKNASSATVKFTNLEIGRQYYVSECTEDGTPQETGTLADGTAYIATFTNGNSVTVTEDDGTETVYFDNEFMRLPDGFYFEGKLTVTKELLDADGKAKNSDKKFYAGIFDDKDYKNLSSRIIGDNVLELDMNGGSESSVTARVKIQENEDCVLYVTETDADGNPVEGAKGFAYNVSYKGDTTVTLNESSLKATVKIINQEKPKKKNKKDKDKDKDKETKKTTTTTTTNTTTSKSVKTGDNTPIALYLIILVAAAAAVVIAFVFRKKRNKSNK